MRPRTIGRITLFGLAAYGALHLASTAFDAGAAWTSRAPARPQASRPLTPRQQPLVSALSRLLHEEGVDQPARWAKAIVRGSPSEDLGYLALVTAQIRRESRFLAPDLEWLYRRIVPELVHELGVDDPIHTIGPMQVQSHRLRRQFERALGRPLDRRQLHRLSLDIETGVAACIAVLDAIVVDYAPDRRLHGWVHEPGPPGLRGDACVLATDFESPSPEAHREALTQKMLSDLTATPLALDGVPGRRTTGLLQRHPLLADPEQLRAAWQLRFAATPPPGIPPRISHDPRLAFVFADFHSGQGSCRVAALQALSNRLAGSELACDGKWGPLTAGAMPRLLAVAEPDATRRADFERLLANGNKRAWVRRQLLRMARRLYRERHDAAAPDALVPDLWIDNTTTRIKGLGRISTAGYVAGSTAFYEDYLRRLCEFTGAEPPGLLRTR